MEQAWIAPVGGSLKLLTDRRGDSTTGKALPAGRRIFKMSVCTMVAYLFQLTKTDKCPKAISNVFTRLWRAEACLPRAWNVYLALLSSKISEPSWTLEVRATYNFLGALANRVAERGTAPCVWEACNVRGWAKQMNSSHFGFPHQTPIN